MALFLWLSQWVSQRHALVTTLGVILGAAPLPYSTMMFSHALAAGCIAIAIWALMRRNGGFTHCMAASPPPNLSPKVAEGVPEGLGSARGSVRWDIIAGLAIGLALASEYSSGLVVVGVVACLVGAQWNRLAAIGVGALPPLSLVPAYSWACLGTPLKLPYSYQASFPDMMEGVYAIKWPDLETLLNLLFSTERGLFFWSPFLLLAWVGCFLMRGLPRRWFVLCYVIPVMHILIISGRVWDWPAGPTLGPRLLTPIIPLLALPCALAVKRFPKTGIALASYSIALITLATLTNACPPYSIGNPLTQSHIPLLMQGKFSPNLGMVLGLPPFASVAVYYAILIGGGWCLWRRLTNLELNQNSGGSKA